MSGPSDLTRWNRAGLTRFRYVDGNAATFLEALRRELLARFPGWQALGGAPADSETVAERLDRLADQYQEVRREWGWEIARALARSTHVLGEYLDAYANEGYLGTATQWDHVRRLVEMLDYHPAPPASAATLLRLTAKGEPGVVEAGLAVQHVPPEGGAPVAFETLEDLEVDPALNELRAQGWNRSVRTFRDEPPPPSPRPIGDFPAITIQGVGPVYQAALDLFKGAPFRVADFLALNPLAAGPRVPRLSLWEFKSKAEVLFDFPWLAADVAPLLDLTLPEVLGRSAAQLAQETGGLQQAMGRLKADLRLVEAVIDQGSFAAARLGDLVATEAAPAPPASPWIAPEESGITAGQLGLTLREGEPERAAVVLIDALDPATGALTLATPPFQPDWLGWTKGATHLLARPEFLARPRLNGPGTVALEEEHALAAGDVVAWQAAGAWTFRRVREVDARGIRLPAGGVPASGTEVFRTLPVARQAGSLFLPLTFRAAAVPDGSGLRLLLEAETGVVADAAGTPRHRQVLVDSAAQVFYLPQDAAAAGAVATAVPGEFLFDGKPGDLASGQWMIGDDGERLHALKIERVSEREDHFALRFESAVEGPRAVAARPTTDVMGVGPVYQASLAGAAGGGIENLGQLAASPLVAVGRVSAVRLWEFRTKARVATEFPGDPADLAPLLDETVSALLARSAADLATALTRPEEEAAALLERLRLVEAVIDQPALSEIRLRDLLPAPVLEPTPGVEIAELVRVWGLFQHDLRPRGWDRNETPLADNRIPLELTAGTELPRLLARGRRLVIEREEDGALVDAREAVVAAVDVAGSAILIDPPLSADLGFTHGNAVLSANVARAGHGESKPEKVLGSGDATRLSQSFVLSEQGVSFVADATQPSGVRAAVEVKIAGQTWQQVASLRDSGPADPHYTVRITEEGYLTLGFGDGNNGRRLPTGTNNVKVSFRKGSGLAGNLAAGSLTKIGKRHPRVAAVRQPFAATGGNDQEPASSLKEQAPASVLTLDRAVSLPDFARLAARQASVWQARAFALAPGLGQRDAIEVVVVPAGGGELGALATSLRDFLAAHALPGVDVRIASYEPAPFDLEVALRVVSAQFDPEQVIEAVRAALFDAFGLERRQLGQDLFLSEVYEVIEAVSGVENSRVVELAVAAPAGSGGAARLAAAGASQRLAAGTHEVLFLDRTRSRLEVTAQEFEL
jgi:hypothetical protein